MVAISSGNVLAIVGIVVGVLAIFTGIFAARRWGNRRMRVLYQWQAAPLLIDSGGGLLKVTFRDFEVADPHLLSIRFQNIGPADIATERFDGAVPLRVILNCTMFGVTRSSDPKTTRTGSLGSAGEISMLPHLFKKGEEWLVEAVVGGQPDPNLQSPLIDTDVVDGPTYIAQLARGTLEILGQSFAAAFVDLFKAIGGSLKS
jgi:hypothetical protein